MTKASTFNLTEMKALFAAPPVLATEFADQFEKVFDQVAASLNVQDMVELILVRDFAIPSWELDRYTRHRTVAFDRKVQRHARSAGATAEDPKSTSGGLFGAACRTSG